MASFGFAGALALVSFGHLEWMFWVGVALAGVFGGLITPATSTALIELTEPKSLPSAMGIQRTAADFGFVAGPVTTGLLSDVFNQSVGVGLTMNAAPLIASGVLWLFAANLHGEKAS